MVSPDNESGLKENLHASKQDCIHRGEGYNRKMAIKSYLPSDGNRCSTLGVSGCFADCFRLVACLMSLFMGLLLVVPNASACSVPVFRYALERWDPDDYGVVVFHDGTLSPDQQAWVDRMDPSKSKEHPFVNCMVRTVDLADNPEKDAVDAWEQMDAPSLPWMVVYYPWTSRAFGSFSSGPFDEGAVSRLVDSPARREIARRLLKGESSVWVLLESGDATKDEQALQRLESRLEDLESSLKLPVINPIDISEGLISIDADELKVDFSAIRISRNDPQEAFFIEMLLGSETHLKDVQEPIAFPIFGRGRLLYSLVGDSIATEIIDDACTFLTGECSCQVKEQNPGVDLVLSVDWDRMVQNQLDIDRELPPLAGFVGMMPEEASSSSTTNDPDDSLADTGASSDSNASMTEEIEPSAETTGTRRSLMFPIILACGGILVGAMVAGFFILKK